MSLVHEALQKAGQEKQKRTGQTASPPPKPVPAMPSPQPSPAAPLTAATPASPARGHSVLVAVVVCVGILAMVSIVWLVSRAAGTYRDTATALNAPAENVVPPSSPTVSHSPVARPTSVTPPTPSPAPPVNPVETPPLREQYKITSISRDPDGTYVVFINDKLRTAGQYIDGATIKEIQADRVILEIDGREEVLRYY